MNFCENRNNSATEANTCLKKPHKDYVKIFLLLADVAVLDFLSSLKSTTYQKDNKRGYRRSSLIKHGHAPQSYIPGKKTNNEKLYILWKENEQQLKLYIPGKKTNNEKLCIPGKKTNNEKLYILGKKTNNEKPYIPGKKTKNEKLLYIPGKKTNND